jgi:hypothetical protein
MPNKLIEAAQMKAAQASPGRDSDPFESEMTRALRNLTAEMDNGSEKGTANRAAPRRSYSFGRTSISFVRGHDGVEHAQVSIEELPDEDRDLGSSPSNSSYADSLTSKIDLEDNTFLTTEGATEHQASFYKTNNDSANASTESITLEPGGNPSTGDYHMPSLVDEGTARARKAYVGPDALRDFFRLYHDTEYVLQCSTRPASARSKYLKLCVETSVTPEPNGIIRKNQSPEISLAGYGLGDERCKPFSEAFPLIPGVQALDLSENRITEKGAEVIISSLTSSNQLKCIDLSKNEIGKRGVAALESYLKDPKCCLEEIHLRQNRLTTERFVVVPHQI